MAYEDGIVSFDLVRELPNGGIEPGSAMRVEMPFERLVHLLGFMKGEEPKIREVHSRWLQRQTDLINNAPTQLEPRPSKSLEAPEIGACIGSV